MSERKCSGISLGHHRTLLPGAQGRTERLTARTSSLTFIWTGVLTVRGAQSKRSSSQKSLPSMYVTPRRRPSRARGGHTTSPLFPLGSRSSRCWRGTLLSSPELIRSDCSLLSSPSLWPAACICYISRIGGVVGLKELWRELDVLEARSPFPRPLR